ncbi:hypothetical protein [Ectothiorhodospira variabilis]|uniref:hypothetical protein n=1 Tax=Ectothiorhodospira variabilis TaxID=505694 RepID=UPI001EFA46B7|nr:hypothetical protein [Ectothiorhodospira variabilis]MCG5498998.1 hypothetical protein [Ectothiorhodospira variabilis]
MPEPGPTTYPKATQITLGHAPREDRLAMDLTLMSKPLPGETAASTAPMRRAWLTRRVVAATLAKLSEVIGQSHPAAERTPDPDEVLQMEHLAAVASKSPAPQGGDPASARSSASAPTPGPTPDPEGYLITELQIEAQAAHVVMGLWGEPLSAPGQGMPVAALKLSRHHAHQILRLLQSTSAKAQWGLEHPAQWMQPMQVPGQKN